MVRAAYSSGNPAIGVGPGNNPAYVDETADVAQAPRSCIADSKAFDNSILCTNESAVIAHATIAERLAGRAEAAGLPHAFATRSATGSRRTSSRAESSTSRSSASRPRRSPRAAGIQVPRGTRVLLAPLERIGDDYPLSREKLCPVLGFYEVATREAAMTACRAMVRRQGAGHSAAIHAERSRDHPALRRGDEGAAHRGERRLLDRRRRLRHVPRADHDHRHRLFRPLLGRRERRAAASRPVDARSPTTERSRGLRRPSMGWRLPARRPGPACRRGEIDYSFNWVGGTAVERRRRSDAVRRRRPRRPARRDPPADPRRAARAAARAAGRRRWRRSAPTSSSTSCSRRRMCYLGTFIRGFLPRVEHGGAGGRGRARAGDRERRPTSR